MTYCSGLNDAHEGISRRNILRMTQPDFCCLHYGVLVSGRADTHTCLLGAHSRKSLTVVGFSIISPGSIFLACMTGPDFIRSGYHPWARFALLYLVPNFT